MMAEPKLIPRGSSSFCDGEDGLGLVSASKGYYKVPELLRFRLGRRLGPGVRVGAEPCGRVMGRGGGVQVGTFKSIRVKS